MKNSYNKVKEYIESFDGYKLLSTEYINCKTNMIIQCPIKHEFWMSYNSFQRGQRCPTCANINKSKRMLNSYNKVKKYIESFDGYKLLSTEYIRNNKKLKMKCPSGHEFWMSYNSFQRGQRCPVCFNLNRGISRTYSYNKVKEYIESFDGYKLLSTEYKKSWEKLMVRCPIGHEYEVKFNSFQQGFRCPTCANINKQNQPHKNKYQDVKEYIESFDGYKLLSIEYKNTISDLLIKCPENHEFRKPLKRFKIGERCPKCLYSILEKEIYEYVFNIYDGVIIENDRKTISPKELDIYLPEYNLAIEFNGLFWHSEKWGKDINYHLNKTKSCKEKDIELLHIFEHEWEFKKDIWKSMISSRIEKNKRIYARKCYIKEIDTETKNIFVEENHLQGKDFSSVKLGLYYQQDLVSVMSFGKTRFNKNYEWEMIRFCNKNYTNVIGAASKLLKYFITIYNPRSIISYANMRYSSGNLYEKIGFIYSHDSKPNYFYFKGKKILSRVVCQKHKLKHFLKGSFDKNKTEKQNMLDNGWNRIFDCGNKVFIWER